MEKQSVTSYLVNYLEQNRIPIHRVAEDTGIQADKLNQSSQESLSADEFLQLCAYLNLRPEEIKQHKK